MKLISINGSDDWALGFWWLVTPQFSGGLRKQLRSVEEIKPTECNAFAMHTSAKYKQIGFCTCNTEELKQAENSKAKSLASHLASHRNGDWLARLTLKDGQQWIVAVIAGTIHPDGDVVGNTEVCEQSFDNLIELGGWDEVLDLNYTQTLEFLEPFLEIKALDTYRVRNIKLPSYTKYIVSGISFVALLTVGVWQYKEWSDHRAMLEAQRIVAESARGKKPKAPSLKWHEYASNKSLIEWCHKAIGLTPLYVDGWQLKSVSCGMEGVTRNFIYTEQASFQKPPLNSVVNMANPRNVMAIHPAPDFNLYNGGVVSYDKLPSLLFDAAKLVEGQITVKWNESSGDIQFKGNSYHWTESSWKLSSKHYSAAKELSIIIPDGTFITKATKDALSGQWTIEGVSYAIK
jgi:hypothetical protein